MKSEKGQAAVEFALVVFFLFSFLYGILDFGRYLYTRSTINQLCQEAARIVSLDDTHSLKYSEIKAKIGNYVSNPSAITVTITPDEVDGKNTETGVNDGLKPRKTGDFAIVTVTYTGFDFWTPFIKNPNITYITTIRVE